MTTVKVTYSKTAAKKAMRAAAAGATVAAFVLTDDPGKPGNYIVMATDAAGDQIDPSAVATIGVVAADPTTLTATVTGPNKFSVQGLKATPAGTPSVATITMTWTDGSVGPFSGDVSFTVTAGGPTGIVVNVAP
jgi:hypothetical protein